jgi:osmoprotectant transport system ATP-binding protein
LGWADRERPGQTQMLGTTFQPETDTMRMALDSALNSPVGLAVAVGGTGRFAGVVTASQILDQVRFLKASVADAISARAEADAARAEAESARREAERIRAEASEIAAAADAEAEEAARLEAAVKAAEEAEAQAAAAEQQAAAKAAVAEQVEQAHNDSDAGTDIFSRPEDDADGADRDTQQVDDRADEPIDGRPLADVDVDDHPADGRDERVVEEQPATPQPRRWPYDFSNDDDTEIRNR